MCGDVLRRVTGDAVAGGAPGAPVSSMASVSPVSPLSPTTPGPVVPDAGFTIEADEPAEPPILGVPAAWFFLVLGALLAPVLTFTPMLRYMGWFVASLTHEMGHCIVGFAMATPMFPAIRIDGHAAAVTTSGYVPWLAYATWGALGLLAWTQREHKLRLGLCVAGAIAYPICAFTGISELLILLGGGLGELAFATICFQRVRSGGFTHGPVERALYGMLGWFLVGRNVSLCFGLATSPLHRQAYEESGSFGLRNDYLRVAEDVLGVPLPAVAFGMLLVAFVPPVLGWWVSRRLDP